MEPPFGSARLLFEFRCEQKAMLLAVEHASAHDLPLGVDACREVELPSRGAVNQFVEVQHPGRFRPQKSVRPGEPVLI